MNTTHTPSQFDIKPHAQIQTINGRTFEFQPEHLCCDDCWRPVDEAYVFATIYGTARAMYSEVSIFDRTKDDEHAIHVTEIK